MASDISQELCPLHPSPDEWLIPSRLEALQVQISPVIRLLKLSGLYKSVLNYWVRLEVAQEISFSDNERSDLLADLKPKWLEKNPSSVDIFDDKDLETKLLASPSVAKGLKNNGDIVLSLSTSNAKALLTVQVVIFNRSKQRSC